MPATKIPERIGCEHSMTTLKDRIRLIRPKYVSVDPVDRASYEPGQVTQCNLTKFLVVPGLERVLQVLVMSFAFSRFITAAMIPLGQGGDVASGL